jgi:hypothetical protein
MQGAQPPAGMIEMARTESGSLALRGPMVPRHSFPPGTERLGDPVWRANATGFIDTGHACRQSRDGTHMLVTGPPPGVVSVGGQRLLMRDIEDLVRRVTRDAMIVALPDALSGVRLAGVTDDADRARSELAAFGAHVLVTEAFAHPGHPDGAPGGSALTGH